MRTWHLVSCAVAALTIAPASALAQASITGIVRDGSGAALAGVLVEAAGPELIERSVPRKPMRRACTGSSISGPASMRSPSRWTALPRRGTRDSS